MTRRLVLCAALLGLVACDDDRELPEDPELVVPGFEVTPPPPPTMPNPGDPPPVFDPPLAIPGESEIPPPPMPEMPPGMMAGQMPQGPVPLAPGFQPQPAVRQGVAGGQVDAAQMAQGCRGYISTEPSHLLQITAPFQNLRVLVNSQQDTTLVVRGPDQLFRCADDDEGLNPIVQGPFAPGVWTVWVGTYNQSAPAPYVIGFTELPQITTAQLAAAPPGAVPPGAVPPGAVPPSAVPPGAAPMQPNPQ